MSSDDQFTALGPAAVGFQTDGANIEHGAEIQGRSLGALIHGNETGLKVSSGSGTALDVSSDTISDPAVNVKATTGLGIQVTSFKTGLFAVSSGKDDLGERGIGVLGNNIVGGDVFAARKDIDTLGTGVLGTSSSNSGVLGFTADPNHAGVAGVNLFGPQSELPQSTGPVGVLGESISHDGVQGVNPTSGSCRGSGH